MKINWNSKYNTIAAYTVITAIAIIVLYLSLSQIGPFVNKLKETIGILQPIIIGFSIAYIFNFILKFYEEKLLNKLNKKLSKRMKRGIGLLLTYITALLIITLFFNFVFPQLIESIIGLINDIPTYINNLGNFLNNILADVSIGEENLAILRDYINTGLNYIIQFVTELLPIIGGIVAKMISSIWNIVLGLIISVYLLIDKEKFFAMARKITFAYFSEKRAKRLIEFTHRSNLTFGKFLSGKIIDSTIIGILTFIILTIFKMPYGLLVSVIIGITNIIPFFGPFIGAIPSFILILFVSPVKALWFIVLIFIIQQIDGNIIGPKILGNSIGISAFWILFSILIAGKFMGLLGMILGVPIFALIYSIIKEIVENKLRDKNLKVETKDYY